MATPSVAEQPQAGPPGPTGRATPYWPGPPDGSFEEALRADSGVLERAAAALPSLPPKDLTRPYPNSLSEALALYHAREEEKRKKGLGKTNIKVKQRSNLTNLQDGEYPGAKQGGGDQSAFWMYVEVRVAGAICARQGPAGRRTGPGSAVAGPA